MDSVCFHPCDKFNCLSYRCLSRSCSIWINSLWASGALPSVCVGAGVSKSSSSGFVDDDGDGVGMASETTSVMASVVVLIYKSMAVASGTQSAFMVTASVTALMGRVGD